MAAFASSGKGGLSPLSAWKCHQIAVYLPKSTFPSTTSLNETYSDMDILSIIHWAAAFSSGLVSWLTEEAVPIKAVGITFP